MMGDFNINLLKCNDNNVCDFTNLLYAHLFFPTITKPIRITKTSASVIDHIWTNGLHNYQTSGIIYSVLSDHFPVFTTLKILDTNTQQSEIIINKRIYNSNLINAFKSLIR